MQKESSKSQSPAHKITGKWQWCALLCPRRILSETGVIDVLWHFRKVLVQKQYVALLFIETWT
jgi:hypothetical protein